jgi:trehalose 6-phosphate phosphatase
MTYLLSEEGRRALRALVGKPILYAFDFDGTLVPIASNRNAVKIPRSTYEWLKELARRAPCAIVSGRALADVESRIKDAVPHLIGNHGIESPLTPAKALASAIEICQGWLRELAARHAKSLKDLGVELEDKRYTLTIHFRGATEPARVRMALLALLQPLSPTPRLIFGKSSVNVLPPGLGGKGKAAHALMVHLRQAGLFFVGDDETDEDVFELTDGLSMGVRVGRNEQSRASYYVKHQGELEEVIRFLVHRIDRTPESLEREDRKAADGRKAANGP